jgi:hypothetical protein
VQRTNERNEELLVCWTVGEGKERSVTKRSIVATDGVVAARDARRGLATMSTTIRREETNNKEGEGAVCGREVNILGEGERKKKRGKGGEWGGGKRKTKRHKIMK